MLGYMVSSIDLRQTRDDHMFEASVRYRLRALCNADSTRYIYSAASDSKVVIPLQRNDDYRPESQQIHRISI